MAWRRPGQDALALGAAVIQRLLPHRPPLLLVDRVEAFARAPAPALRASRCFGAGEPFFAGHFPGLPIVPGVLLLEGLAQAAALLRILVTLERAREAEGGDAGDVLEALRNLDRAYRLDPGYRPDDGDAALASIAAIGGSRVGVLAASDVKFLHPIFPGEQVHYEVRSARELGHLWHFEAEARAGGEIAARGTLALAWLDAALPGRAAPGRRDG